MNPESVAVIGASRNSNSPGGRVMSNLSTRFPGRAWGVNPNVSDDDRFRPSLSECDATPDLVVVATPAATVPRLVEEAAGLGVPAAVVLSAGFEESQRAGIPAREDIHRVATDAGMALIGPNTIGAINVEAGLYATFSNVVSLDNRGGGVAVIGQSGGMAATLYDMLVRRGIGVSHLIATGNEFGVSLGQVANWVVSQPQVRTVVGFLENVSGWNDLESAILEGHQCGKRFAFCRAGKSPAGRAASASHVAAIAGDDEVLASAFRSLDVLDATSLGDLVDVSAARSQVFEPFDGRIAIVTSSGGGGALLSDLAESQGLKVPTFGEEAQDSIAALVPSFASPANPVDCTASVQTDPEQYRAVLKATAMVPEVGGLIAQLGPLDPIAESLSDSLVDLKREMPTLPLIVAWGGGDERFKRALSRKGVPVFGDPRSAVIGIRALVVGHPRRKRPVTPRDPEAVPRQADGGETRTLNEAQVQRLLIANGIKVPEGAVASTPSEAVEISRDLNGPLAVKLLAAGVEHRSDVGGVLLGIQGDEAIAAAAERIVTVAEEVGAELDGILLEEMAPTGFELLCGIRRDVNVGPVAIVGLGGILAELSADIAVEPVPIDRPTALRMVSELGRGSLVGHPRGLTTAAAEHVVTLMLQLSDLAASNPEIAELELNPVVATDDGVWICDGLARTAGVMP
jgi:acyl-CoA synthetase (NDP forming)